MELEPQPPVIADQWPGGRAPVLIADADYDRRKFIGSSNVAAIMAMTPTINDERYTALDVYMAKIGEEDENEGMDAKTRLFLDRRRRWEPVVVQMLREELDAEVVSTNLRYVDGDVPYFAAEADYEWRVDEPSAAALGLPPELIGTIQDGEIKSVSPRVYSERFGWGEPGTNEIPVQYDCQVQFGLSVRRRQICLVTAMVGLDDMMFYPVHAYPESIVAARDACHHFWNRHVLARVPPPAQTIPDLNKLYRAPKVGLRVDADSEIGLAALRLRAVKGNLSALELDSAALEFQVKNAMKDAEELYVDGRKVASWSEQNWGRLDQEALKIGAPDVHKKFYRRGRHRVMKTYSST